MEKKVVISVNYGYRLSLHEPFKYDNLMCEAMVESRPKALNAWFGCFYKELTSKHKDNWFINKVVITGDENPNFWS